MFENGCIDTDDDDPDGRQSTAANSEIAARVNKCILAYKRIITDEISNELVICHGSVHKIIADQLNFNKACV